MSSSCLIFLFRSKDKFYKVIIIRQKQEFKKKHFKIIMYLLIAFLCVVLNKINSYLLLLFQYTEKLWYSLCLFFKLLLFISIFTCFTSTLKNTYNPWNTVFSDKIKMLELLYAFIHSIKLDFYLFIYLFIYF